MVHLIGPDGALRHRPDGRLSKWVLLMLLLLRVARRWLIHHLSRTPRLVLRQRGLLLGLVRLLRLRLLLWLLRLLLLLRLLRLLNLGWLL